MTPPRAHGRVQARRDQLLQLLRASPDGRDVADLAAATGLHVNTVRFHLERLIRAGLAVGEARSQGRRGRPRNVYVATRDLPVEGSYRLLATILARAVSAGTPPVDAAEAAGRSWARDAGPAEPHQPHARSVELFAELGFHPTTVTTEHSTQIVLHACPFRELATVEPDVVCGVHLGLLRGTLAATVPASAARLRPFVAPEVCVAEIPAAHRGDPPPVSAALARASASAG